MALSTVPFSKLVISLFVIFLTIQLGRRLIEFATYEARRIQRKCPPIKSYPQLDIFLGLDYVYQMLRALKNHRFLEFQNDTYLSQGAKVWKANFLGNRMVYSSEAENMKSMSTSDMHSFAVEPIRIANNAVTPFTGRGVSTSDGAKWQFGRDLVKPYFDRAGFTNIARLELHVSRLIDKIPTDGTTVDMQPLFQRWFLDTSTDFLFGESLNSLTYPERDWPQRDMVSVMRGMRVRLQLSSFVFLHRDKEFFAACKRIHSFLDGYIDKAYEQLKQQQATGKPACYSDGTPRDDFLWTIAPHIPNDKLELRTQLTGVWFPSNETTSILMSNTIFALARNPHVVSKLRKEVLAFPDAEISFETLRSITYLRYVVNETHRLYPVSLQTVRAVVKDTTLPTGGGAGGNLPLFLRKGDIMHCNRYIMHRDPSIWGPDADEFIPERWESARPMWGFVPFGGGPRICPAHVMVDTEVSYMLFRILQRFERIEARDVNPYTGVMRAGPSNLHGCKVCFVPA